MLIQFKNFAHSQLAVGLGSGDTSLTVTGGHGARFPTLSAGQYFYVTLENAALAREVVKVTARATDAFTIVRAQDDTTALAWNAADSVSLRFNAAAIADVFASSVQQTSATGSVIGPAGTTAQRDAVPAVGYTRFNTTLNSPEVWNGTEWAPMGGGATGAPGNYVFVENDQVVTGDYTLTAGKNAMSAGPISIDVGVTVTIGTGQTWTIV